MIELTDITKGLKTCKNLVKSEVNGMNKQELIEQVGKPFHSWTRVEAEYLIKLCAKHYHEQVIEAVEKLDELDEFGMDEIIQAINDVYYAGLVDDECEHGKGMSDYCEPCGRIHGSN